MPVDSLAGKKVLGAYSPCRVVDLGAVKLVFLSGLTSGGEAPHDTKAQAEIEGVAVIPKKTS